ncbi:hypothetical protein [Paenibacillus sp.]|jgi:hypothetical protein|uniref:hypothetical protein n=1 Tax=Paenibacillus sp. TaxID=58172 RepID=UPI00282AC4D7|nr:hypothetical protein [Paenibacillus sp.]MDR0266666.1 hypothetical protein [Paenibacillus sp.]
MVRKSPQSIEKISTAAEKEKDRFPLLHHPSFQAWKWKFWANAYSEKIEGNVALFSTS